MAKTKVLIIRNNLPGAFGGGETYQLTLAEQLRRHHFEPIIISSCRQLKREAKRRGIHTKLAWRCRMQNWSGWRNLLLPLYFLWQLILTLRYCWLFLWLRPAAVNVQSRDDLIAATIAGKLCCTRVLWTDHADFRNWVFQNIEVKHKNLIGKTILKLAPWAYRIILISDADGNYFRSLKGCAQLQNIAVIKNGVIDEAHEYHAKPAMDFCYVGRIVKEKGIGELLEAFELVVKKNKQAKLHLYGDGPDFDYFKKHCKSQSVLFHGFTDQPLKMMAKSQIYVLPSYAEGLSLSLLEACMMSRTIIATEVGGNPEIIQDCKNGRLVPAKDSEALARAMLRLLNDPELCREYGKAARKTYELEFDFVKTFEREMLLLYVKEKK